MSSGRVWLVTGPPGSGKTTFGRALAVAAQAALLDQDVMTNPLLQHIADLVGAADDLDHPALRGGVRAARYQCLLDAAADNVDVGRSVVVVAPFTAELADPVALARVAARLTVAPRVVWVRVPTEVAVRRRQQRALPRDLVTRDLPGSASPPAVPFVEVDGAADPRREAARILA